MTLAEVLAELAKWGLPVLLQLDGELHNIIDGKSNEKDQVSTERAAGELAVDALEAAETGGKVP